MAVSSYRPILCQVTHLYVNGIRLMCANCHSFCRVVKAWAVILGIAKQFCYRGPNAHWIIAGSTGNADCVLDWGKANGCSSVSFWCNPLNIEDMTQLHVRWENNDITNPYEDYGIPWVKLKGPLGATLITWVLQMRL